MSWVYKEVSEIAQLNITLKELDVKGSRHQTFKFQNVVDLFNEDKLNPEKLVSNVLDYTKVGEAMELIENKPEEICKIVLKFD